MVDNFNLTSLELFAGAGGLAIGTAAAGFRHSAVIEKDAIACSTLLGNKSRGVAQAGNWKIIEADIATIDLSPYVGIDLLCGGPPCQPFSMGGARKGRNDNRDMFPNFIDSIAKCRPRAFLIENVKGITAGSFIEYFSYLSLRLTFPAVTRKPGEKWTEHRSRLERLFTSGKNVELCYNVIHEVLNSADYGVPQRRQRVFIVGIRSDLGVEYSFPQATHSSEDLLHDQWVSGIYWDEHEVATKARPARPKMSSPISSGKIRWRTVRDAIHDLPKPTVGKPLPLFNHFLNPGARLYKGHSGSPLDWPAKTLKAGQHGVPGGENMVRMPDESVRYFSIRECARLQGFPDDWEFKGAWCNCMRQVGNAVPVDLARVVADPLATALRNFAAAPKQPLA